MGKLNHASKPRLAYHPTEIKDTIIKLGQNQQPIHPQPSKIRHSPRPTVGIKSRATNFRISRTPASFRANAFTPKRCLRVQVVTNPIHIKAMLHQRKMN
ncbi:hypothetical protein Nepgr_014820 [Nepenthes gracilis]|uniref:Uncharacterized protein n=1 Tax=Nepenthes gracilis TaxID=150966 RepID=A0AAD3SLU3_NEPGR|nr:hypothetical protein Nepgr_014820 [Nepenthes gracilis]